MQSFQLLSSSSVRTLRNVCRKHVQLRWSPSKSPYNNGWVEVDPGQGSTSPQSSQSVLSAVTRSNILGESTNGQEDTELLQRKRHSSVYVHNIISFTIVILLVTTLFVSNVSSEPDEGLLESKVQAEILTTMYSRYSCNIIFKICKCIHLSAKSSS